MSRTSAATADATTSTPREGGTIPLVAICLGFFMVMLDTTIVNVALPSIGTSLHGSVVLLQWVVDGYTLAFAALLLTAGAVSDALGPRRVFIGGLAVFGLFSALCAAAPNGGALIAFRALQGVGAAALVPSSLSLINSVYPTRAARARAIGIWGGMGGIAAALGPVAGGVLTAAAGWQLVFLVNVPVAVIAFLLVRYHVPAVRPGTRRGVDFPGQVLGIATLLCVTYAVIDGGSRGWQARDIALIAAGLALAAGFVVLEARRPDPMLPVRLLRDGAFATANLTGLLLNVGFYGQFFVLSLYLQQLRHYSVLTAGLLLLPEAVGAMIGSPLGGRATARVGARPAMLIGLVLGAIGFAALLATTAHTSYGYLVPVTFVAGFGMAFAMPAATAAAIQAAPASHAGIAAGVVNAARQTGSVLGVAILGALPQAGNFLPGFHQAVAASAVIFLAGAALNAVNLLASKARSAQPPGAGTPAVPDREDTGEERHAG